MEIDIEDIFDDFLKFFFPDAETLFDFERGFEYLDKELEQLFPPNDGKYACKYVDKLVKVHNLTGAEEWVLVHIEVQGYRDMDFTDRMFTYYYRIWDKYRKPITAFAILTDDCPHYLPFEFEQHCLGTSLRFRFNSFKVLDQSDEALAVSDNPFAQAILVTKTALIGNKLSIDELYRLKIQLAKRLLDRDMAKAKIGKLMHFLQFYVRLGNEELDREFEREVDKVIDQTKFPMKIEEAILHIAKEEAKEEAILERDTTFVQNLFRETNFTEQEIARLAGVTGEFVKEVRSKMK